MLMPTTTVAWEKEATAHDQQWSQPYDWTPHFNILKEAQQSQPSAEQAKTFHRL